MKQSDVILKPGELREKTQVELTNMIRDLEEGMFRLRFRKGAGQLKQTASIRTARRNLARVKTVLRQRELSNVKGGA